MTTQEIWDETRYITNTDTETYTDTDLLRGTNVLQREMFQSILQWQGFRRINEDTYVHDFLTTYGLNPGENGYDGEYLFDTQWVMVTGFALKYGATDYYVPAKIYDPDQYVIDDVDAESYNAQFSESAPEVYFRRGTYKIRPTLTAQGATVVDGIRVNAISRQPDLVDTTVLPVGEQNFMQWYSLKLALRHGKFRPGVSRNDVLTDLLLLEKKLAKFYMRAQKATTTSFQPKQLNFR